MQGKLGRLAYGAGEDQNGGDGQRARQLTRGDWLGDRSELKGPAWKKRSMMPMNMPMSPTRVVKNAFMAAKPTSASRTSGR